MSLRKPVSTQHGRRARQQRIAECLPDLKCLSNNVIDVYERSSAEERAAGAGWYSVAHELAIDIAGDAVTGAGIIAALSPQVSWTDNIAGARALVQHDYSTLYSHTALPLSIERATAIRDGERPSDVLGGPKVRSFYRNIVLPLRSGAVTVDRHAISVAVGFVVGDRRIERCGVYSIVAGAYRSAARTLDVLPHQLQAATWLTWRRELNESDASSRYVHLRTDDVVDF